MKKRRFLQIGSGVIVGLYIIASTFYSLSVPIWEAPDENGHFAYIRHLRETRTLPIQGQHAAGEAHQPPLYYVVAAIFSLPGDISSPVGRFRSNPDFMWGANGGNDVNINLQGTAQTLPFQGQARALQWARFASVAMGAATIYLVMRIGRHIFPEQPEIGLLAGGLTALTPQFLFITGVLNNDNLLILCATGTIWQLLQAIEKPQQQTQWVLVGLWLSAAVLTKLTAVSLVFLVGIVICAVSWQRRSWRTFWQASFWQTGAIVGGLLLVLTGWWFWRNQVLYGDPSGNIVYERLFAANVRQNPLRWWDIRQLFSVQFRSFWAVFGWMNVPGPDWYFAGIRVVLVLAGLGWVRLLSQRAWFKQKWRSIAIFALVVVIQEATILTMSTRCNAVCYQGRFMLPTIGAIMLLMSIGLVSLFKPPWNHRMIGLVPLFFLITAIWMPIALINPAYSMTPEPGWRAWLGAEKVQANFNNQFALRSYTQEVNKTDIQLQLYWQAVAQPVFDYSAFVHLVDASGQLVAQADAGLGQSINYLPTAWAAGDMVAELYTLTFPDGLPPGTYQIRTGVYNWVSGERLPVYVANTPVGDFVILSTIQK